MPTNNADRGVGERVGIPDTFSELVTEYGSYARQVRNLVETSISLQGNYIERFFKAHEGSAPAELIGTLSRESIRSFIFDFAGRHGPGSQGSMQRSLRSFLKFCNHAGYLPYDLSSSVPTIHRRRMATVPKGIEDSTVALLLESINKESPVGLRDLAIIQLLTTYGVRGIQIRHLCLDDIDWERDRIHFPAAKRGKPVVQHLTPQAGNLLLEYISKARPNNVEYNEVFLSARKPYRPINQSSSFSAIIRRRLRAIDVKLPKGVSYGTHSFRHGFATRLTGQVPLKHIGDMLGHRDLSSSYIYSKVDLKSLGEVALPWPKEND